MSDLHLEFLNSTQVRKLISRIKSEIGKEGNENDSEHKTLILAGDICTCFSKSGKVHGHLQSFLKEMASLFDLVYYVPGNHEYFNIRKLGVDIETVDHLLEETCSTISNKIHFLNKKTIVHPSGYLVIGFCNWTSCNEEAFYHMNESETVFRNHGERENLFREHDRFLKEKINEYRNANLLIITHHVPSQKMLSKDFDPKYNDCYGNHYESLFEKIEQTSFWCFGHSHESTRQYIISDQPLVIEESRINFYSNPYGYPGEKKKTHFVIEPFISIDNP